MFDLYREAKTGETPIVNAETLKKAGLDITKKWILVKSGLTTNANGIIDTSDSNNATNYTHGLANGDYYLVETKTVDGYNLLTKPVKVKLDVTATTTWQKTNVYDASGNLVKHGTVTKTTFTHTSNNGDATKRNLLLPKSSTARALRCLSPAVSVRCCSAVSVCCWFWRASAFCSA